MLTTVRLANIACGMLGTASTPRLASVNVVLSTLLTAVSTGSPQRDRAEGSAQWTARGRRHRPLRQRQAGFCRRQDPSLAAARSRGDQSCPRRTDQLTQRHHDGEDAETSVAPVRVARARHQSLVPDDGHQLTQS